MTRRLRRDSFDDIFDQMQNALKDFQEASRDFSKGLTGKVPVDIREEKDEVVVTADLPGVSKEDINLKADEKKLEISAQASQKVKEENEKYVRKERSSRSFRRKISWPARIDPETVSASYDEGVLEVRAEKEETGGRDIEIE